MRNGNIIKQLSFCLLTFLLGFAAGGIVWILLQAMQVGIELLWGDLPDALGLAAGTPGTLIYNLIVCFIGAVFIALVQKHQRFLDTSLIVWCSKPHPKFFVQIG